MRRMLQFLFLALSGVGMAALTVAGEPGSVATWTQMNRLLAPRGVYFDTGFLPDQNSRVVMTVDVKSTSEYWFGAWNVDWNKQAFALGNDGGGVYVGYGNSGSGTDSSVVPVGVHTVELDRGVYKLDGVIKRSIGAYTFKLAYPLYLCAQNRKGTMLQRGGQGTLVLLGAQLYDNGVCVRNFVPCRQLDGTAGLADFDRGIFLAPSGGTATVEGVTNPNTGPAVAHWTNALGDGDVANAANWACTNDFGEAVVAVPTAETIVCLPDDRVFNCTNGAPFACRHLVLPTSLAGDCDWRGLGAYLSISGRLRLNGHRLQLSTLAGAGSLVDGAFELLDSVRAPNGALVDTGFTPKSTSRVVMDLTVGGTLENWFGSGGDGSSWWKDCAFALSNDGRGVYIGYGADSGTFTSAQGTTLLSVGTRYTIDLNRNVFRYSAHGSGVTNVWGTRAEATFTGKRTLYLFADHQGSGSDSNTFKSGNNVTCHACQIYDNGVLVRDYVPVKRLADGEVGLVDRAHDDAFYGSQRTTKLVAGNGIGTLGGEGELVLDLPEGATPEPSAVDVDVHVVGARQWIGGAAGDWNDAANWSEGQVPVAGELVQVRGTVQLTYGGAGANVRNLLVRVGEDGGLEQLAGAVWTEVKLSVKRVRVGVPLTVEMTDVAGFLPARTARIQWFRGASVSKKDYVAVAEGESYTPSADDYEHWVKCVVSDGTGVFFEKEFFCSPLPVLYLTTDDGLTPTQNKEKHDGWLFVQGNDEWKNLYDGAMTINVRGNSTAKEPKKPWKLKLDEKTKMFGLPKSKHWVLLANYYDETNLRNRLAYDFANEIGSLGMKSTWVECVLNGEWQGLYLFSEHVRVAKDRVAVHDWENVAEETADALAASEGFTKEDRKALETLMTDDFRWLDTGVVVYTNRTYDLGLSVPNFAFVTNDISGGYLFQFEYDEWHGEQVWFNVYAPPNTSQFLMPTQLKGAEGMVTSTRVHDWCVDFLRHYGNAVTAVDGYDAGESYVDICDVESLVSYFLVLEMFGNDDGRYRSVYAYKDIGGPFKYGPVWDFDFGVGNYQMGYNPEAWLANYHKANAFKEWADDPWFCTLLWTRYPAARAAFEEIVKDGGLIDQYYEQLRIPAEANDAKWHHHYGYYGGIYGTGSHPGLKAFFKTRLAWMDRQFADVPTLMASLKAGTRNTPSATPYTPDAQKLPIQLVNAPEGWVPQRETLRFGVTLGTTQAATVGVYANGRKVGDPVPVVDGAIAVRVPTALLTARPGEPNCVSLVAWNASGACVARNFVLVWVDWKKAGFNFIIR